MEANRGNLIKILLRLRETELQDLARTLTIEYDLAAKNNRRVIAERIIEEMQYKGQIFKLVQSLRSYHWEELTESQQRWEELTENQPVSEQEELTHGTETPLITTDEIAQALDETSRHFEKRTDASEKSNRDTKASFITTDDMVKVLEMRTGASDALSRTFLGTLVGILQWILLLEEQHGKRFFVETEDRDVVVSLNQHFALGEQSSEQLIEHISRDIGLYPEDTALLLDTFQDEIISRLEKHKEIEFEPLGRILSDDGSGYKIILRQNFIPH